MPQAFPSTWGVGTGDPFSIGVKQSAASLLVQRKDLGLTASLRGSRRGGLNRVQRSGSEKCSSIHYAPILLLSSGRPLIIGRSFHVFYDQNLYGRLLTHQLQAEPIEYFVESPARRILPG